MAYAAVCAALMIGGCSGPGPEERLQQARAALERRDINSASVQLKSLLQDYPEATEARLLLGRLSAEMGDFATAERELRRASDSGYRLDEVLPLHALSLLELDQPEKALKDVDPRRVADGGARVQLSAYRARAMLRLNKLAEATELVDQALRIQPESGAALVTRAQIYARNNDLAGARDVLIQLLRRNESDVEALLFKATIDKLQGRSADADAAWLRAISVAPTLTGPRATLAYSLIEQNKIGDAQTQVEALRKLPGGQFEALVLDGHIAYREKKFEIARNAAVQALKLAPEYLPALALAAASEHALGNLAPAEAVLQKIVRHAPGHAPSRTFLAEVLLKQGNFQGVQQILQPLLNSGGADPASVKLLAQAAMQLGDFQTAHALFQRLGTSNPKDIHARAAAASARILAGDAASGIAELERIGAQDADQIVSDVMLVLTHMRSRHWSKAEAAVAVLGRKQPAHPLTHNLRGTVLAAKGDRQGARAAFERALALNADYVVAAVNLAKLDARDGKVEQAQARLERFLARHPSNARALVALAELKGRAGASRAEVGELLQKAHGENPRLLPPRLALVDWYIEGGEYRKAIEQAQQAAWAHPNVPDVLATLGRAQLAAGDVSQAVATYRQLVQANEREARSHVGLAHALAAADDLDAARRSLERALQIDPDHSPARLALVEVEARAGRESKALELVAAYHRAEPNSAQAYIVEGDLHARNRKYPAAASAYGKALALRASTPAAIKRHDALIAANHGAEAQKLAETWLQRHPKDASFRLYLAQRALASRDYESAKRGFLDVLAIQPATSGVLNNLAWACLKSNDNRALDYALQAYKLAPDDAHVLDTLGVIRLQRGDFGDAVELLGRASTMAPRSPSIAYNYASALARTGRKDEARQVLEAALELKMPFSELDEARKLLRSL